VGPSEPILATFGDKRLIAFYVPDSGRGDRRVNDRVERVNLSARFCFPQGFWTLGATFTIVQPVNCGDGPKKLWS
ncbi:MAG: hypothetical protein WBW37_10805, partial [Methyloceanibacter sp.]